MAQRLSTRLRDDSSTTVQVADTTGHGINVPRGTLVGHITPVAFIDMTQLCRAVANPNTHGQSRVEIRQVLACAFRISILTGQHQEEVLDIWL